MQYLAAGFIIVWLLVTVYVVYMALRQRKMEQELASLEEALRDAQAKAKSALAADNARQPQR